MDFSMAIWPKFAENLILHIELMMMLIAEENDLVDVYTVEEVIDKMGCGVFQVLLSLMAGGMWVSNCVVVCFGVIVTSFKHHI